VHIRTLKGLSEEKWGPLLTLFTKYGPIPRLLLDHFFPPDIDGTEMAEKELHRRISTYDLDLVSEIRTLLATKIPELCPDYSADNSGSLFLIRPCKVPKFKYVSMLAVLDIASPHIAYRIGAATAATGLWGAQLIYEHLLGHVETKASAGWIFKARMHLVFQCGGRFAATPRCGSTAITLEMGDKPYCSFAKVSKLGNQLREQFESPRIIPDMIGVYVRPQQCDLFSVDSFIITKSPTTKGPALVLFQLAVSTSCSVNARMLESMWAGMPATLKRTPPILVFVVPDDVAGKLSRQTKTPSDLNTSDSNTPKFNHCDQYVLAVSSKTLWKYSTPDRDEPVAEPAKTNAPERHVLRPRSVMPVPTARQKAKRKAAPAEADNEADIMASRSPKKTRGGRLRKMAAKTEPPAEMLNLWSRSTTPFVPEILPIAAPAKRKRKYNSTPVAEEVYAPELKRPKARPRMIVPLARAERPPQRKPRRKAKKNSAQAEEVVGEEDENATPHEGKATKDRQQTKPL